MYKIVIVRDLFFEGNEASLGTCFIYKNNRQLFKCESLERGWLNNKNQVSCVPQGVYDCKYEHSPRFGKNLWELKGVPNRSECKFHAANYWHQLNGCIALGRNRKYIDGDLIMDITSSRDMMREFERILMPMNAYTVKVHIIDLSQLT